MKCIGIIGAMEQEVSRIKEMMKEVKITTKASMDFYEGILEGKKVVVVRSGIGKVNAGMCTQILADIYGEEVKKIITVVQKYEEKYEKKIPVILAGGIYDHADYERAFSLGADGVQIATRFVTTEECDADEHYKQTYIQAEKEDIVIVKSPVGMPGRAIRNALIERVEKEKEPIKKCYNCLAKCNPVKVPYCITKALIDAVKGDVENGLVFCGSNVGRINQMMSVHELMQELVS